MRFVGGMVVLVALGAVTLNGQAGLDIELANGTKAEAMTRDALLKLVEKYDVEDWLFTREIVIDENSIPHSHPVLTIHTRHVGDEPALLSTFLHEQFHWLEEVRSEPRDRAMQEFRQRFPDAPHGHPEGGRDQESTYLHLIVCDLELQAMSELLGEETARSTLNAYGHYRWIYDKVLGDPTVREVNRRHGLTIDQLR